MRGRNSPLIFVYQTLIILLLIDYYFCYYFVTNVYAFVPFYNTLNIELFKKYKHFKDCKNHKSYCIIISSLLYQNVVLHQILFLANFYNLLKESKVIALFLVFWYYHQQCRDFSQ